MCIKSLTESIDCKKIIFSQKALDREHLNSKFAIVSLEMEFIVNEFLSLKLEEDITMIYVAEEPFIQCKFLLLEIPTQTMTSLDDMKSIDEAAQELDRSLEPEDEFTRVDKIPPETEFWGHCSNLQAWYENDYNTSLLHSNLAFPLLKKLTEAGDLLARKVFKDEVASRYDTGGRKRSGIPQYYYNNSSVLNL